MSHLRFHSILFAFYTRSIMSCFMRRDLLFVVNKKYIESWYLEPGFLQHAGMPSVETILLYIHSHPLWETKLDCMDDWNCSTKILQIHNTLPTSSYQQPLPMSANSENEDDKNYWWSGGDGGGGGGSISVVTFATNWTYQQSNSCHNHAVAVYFFIFCIF